MDTRFRDAFFWDKSTSGSYGNTACLRSSWQLACQDLGFSWGKPVGFLHKNWPELSQLPLGLAKSNSFLLKKTPFCHIKLTESLLNPCSVGQLRILVGKKPPFFFIKSPFLLVQSRCFCWSKRHFLSVQPIHGSDLRRGTLSPTLSLPDEDIQLGWAGSIKKGIWLDVNPDRIRMMMMMMMMLILFFL